MRPSASAGRPGKCPATLVHVFPPSRVTCASPSSVPTQITLSSDGATLMVRMVLYVSAPEMSLVIGPPLVRCFDLSLRVRSGEMTSQCAPPLVDLKTTLAPMYTVLASLRETSTGVVQLKR